MVHLFWAATQTSTAYSWIYIIIGLLTIMGAGGAYGLIQWIKRQGVRDDKLDRAADVVLGTEDRAGLITSVPKLQASVESIKAEMSPNGGKSLGDAVQRVEIAVNDINNKFQQHIGDSNRVHTDLWRAIKKEDTKV